MKNINLPKSSSQFQSEGELFIITSFLKQFYPLQKEDNLKETFTLENASNIKMQLDLYLKDAKVIGEIYVTELPFNSGRKRKFQSDILKMITFEKINKEHYKKFYFLTADEEKLKTLHGDVSDGSFYKHTREKSLIGKNTWLNLTLESFGIELYYYCIGELFFEKLKKTRKLQKEGMREKVINK
ncbi:hypothetical protein [Brumimicrobium oceani]|uniref:Uncharacterized protein n=1 Tax=Brumimicrobium oceani TaxID=2100725 RepID=A0A2U2XEX5_9FLAO|nr:hypothetical protein [Brumimicrobium oceani]PWH86290.1 hypothetical protein DIT68_03360 [Brumimicrobium oceani]